MSTRRISYGERIDNGTLVEDVLKSVSNGLEGQDIKFTVSNRDNYVMGMQFMMVVMHEIMEADGLLPPPSSRLARRFESIQSELLEMRFDSKRRNGIEAAP